MTTLSRSIGKSSSSAAICASAVSAPVPTSTLPVKSVTVLSGCTASQAESSPASGGTPPGIGPFRRAVRGQHVGRIEQAEGDDEATGKFEQVAPAEGRRTCRSCFASCCGGFMAVGDALHRTDDAHMGAAAAQIAVQRLLDVVARRMRIPVEQRLRGHDHATDAVAALGGLLVDESLLQLARMLLRAEPLEGGDLLAFGRGERRDAGMERRCRP